MKPKYLYSCLLNISIAAAEEITYMHTYFACIENHQNHRN